MRGATLAVALGLAFASYAVPQDAAAQKQDAEQGDSGFGGSGPIS